jgi:cell division protein YceG involved in septum cleavage
MKLEDEGLIGDSRAFVYLAVVNDLTHGLQQGTFVLRKNMTPDQVVNALLAPPDVK